MQVQAAEVKIDRTHNGFRAVGYALLRVDEPGRVLINAHAALGKAGVIAARDREDQLLSGMPGVMIRTSTPLDAASRSVRCISSL